MTVMNAATHCTYGVSVFVGVGDPCVKEYAVWWKQIMVICCYWLNNKGYLTVNHSDFEMELDIYY